MPKNTHPAKALSLHPLTTEEALKAALRIKPADLKTAMEKGKKSKK